MLRVLPEGYLEDLTVLLNEVSLNDTLGGDEVTDLLNLWLVATVNRPVLTEGIPKHV